MIENINIPKIPITVRALRYPALSLALSYIGYLIGLGIGISISFSIFVVVLLVFVDTYQRAVKFKVYLKKFGVDVSSLDDEGSYNIMGAIPFNNTAVMLSMSPSEKGVEISRMGVYQFISWDDVESIKKIGFLGKPLLRLKLISQNSFDYLAIPWSNQANEYLPNRFIS